MNVGMTYLPLLIRSSFPFCRIVGPFKARVSFFRTSSSSPSFGSIFIAEQSLPNSATLGVKTAFLCPMIIDGSFCKSQRPSASMTV